jgi:hypothetical protein
MMREWSSEERKRLAEAAPQDYIKALFTLADYAIRRMESDEDLPEKFHSLIACMVAKFVDQLDLPMFVAKALGIELMNVVGLMTWIGWQEGKAEHQDDTEV